MHERPDEASRLLSIQQHVSMASAPSEVAQFQSLNETFRWARRSGVEHFDLTRCYLMSLSSRPHRLPDATRPTGHRLAAQGEVEYSYVRADGGDVRVRHSPSHASRYRADVLAPLAPLDEVSGKIGAAPYSFC